MKPIIEIKNISKKYLIHHEQKPYLTVRESLLDFFKSRNRNEVFYALKDISFDVDASERAEDEITHKLIRKWVCVDIPFLWWSVDIFGYTVRSVAMESFKANIFRPFGFRNPVHAT